MYKSIIDIIPKDIIEKYKKEVLDLKYSEKDLKEINKESKLWSLEPNFQLGVNKAYLLNTEKAFGNWVVLKYSYGAPFIWNLKLLQKRYLTPFELYVLIQEFQINKYNSLNIQEGEDVVIKDNKKFINGIFVEELKPLDKISYIF